ncbi:hypothetical protein HNP77_001686 [Treponema rectale]|uniref:Uncharacterized protein n=1 Tax=Treponema rectale TaxID=744512 RepID=A0A840SC22_9SPIR|nr:hypothetical protein [Treponema rectale]
MNIESEAVLRILFFKIIPKKKETVAMHIGSAIALK